MQTLVIDTYKVVTRLQQKGFSKDQAEALVSAAQEIDLSAFVTKNDLNNLKLDMIKWMVGTQLAYAAIIVAVVLTR
jgi:hypothetical protein